MLQKLCSGCFDNGKLLACSRCQKLHCYRKDGASGLSCITLPCGRVDSQTFKCPACLNDEKMPLPVKHPLGNRDVYKTNFTYFIQYAWTVHPSLRDRDNTVEPLLVIYLMQPKIATLPRDMLSLLLKETFWSRGELVSTLPSYLELFH